MNELKPLLKIENKPIFHIYLHSLSIYLINLYVLTLYISFIYTNYNQFSM